VPLVQVNTRPIAVKVEAVVGVLVMVNTSITICARADARQARTAIIRDSFFINLNSMLAGPKRGNLLRWVFVLVF
jgi:hypothetical protein